MKTLVDILLVLLDLATFVIIVNAIMSWLIQFNVISTSNDFVRTLWNTLERILDPIYRPIRRIMPDLGGLDLSPIIVLLLIRLIREILARSLVG